MKTKRKQKHPYEKIGIENELKKLINKDIEDYSKGMRNKLIEKRMRELSKTYGGII